MSDRHDAGTSHPYCVLCGREYPLNEHHTQYHDPERTITVCESCHNKIHNEPGYMDHLKPPDKPRMDNQMNWKEYKYGSEKYAPD